MLYMLDTNILVYAMRHPASTIHTTLARHRIDELCVSMITMAELYHGAQKSKSPE